jgi:hypothetical protein
MNKEYLEAKVDLCLNQAEQDIKQQEIARAIKNLQRANSAMSRLFDLDEGESVGCCNKCNAWDDCLESGVCQTCIKEEDESE